MEAYTAQLANLTQGLTLVNTKVDRLTNNLHQMISATVSSELSKFLLDDKFKTLQESVDPDRTEGVRGSTRTAEMTKTQSNIYATLTELKESIALIKPVLEKLQSQQTSVPPSSGQKGGEKRTQPPIIKPAVIHHPQSAFQPPLKGVKITEGGQQPLKKPAEPTYTGKGKGIAGEASQTTSKTDPTLSIR